MSLYIVFFSLPRFVLILPPPPHILDYLHCYPNTQWMKWALEFGIFFTRKMFVTYRAAASQAIQIVDRKVWQLHEALPWPEWPKRFDDGGGGVRHDVDDVNGMKQLPLLQPIGACS